ncbi:MAG: sce7725 family protein [Aequorivita sp.]
MYQPYIRGKQFELIGLRELASDVLFKNRDKISPIIEPVRDSSTFKTTLRELAKNDINFTVIVNPQVGTFKDTKSIFKAIKTAVDDYKNYQIGIIFFDGIKHEDAIKFLSDYKDKIPTLSIIHNAIFDNITDVLAKYLKISIIKYNVINLSLTTRRYHRNFDRDTLIELDDYFRSQEKNSDYLRIEESIFSEEHLYYKEEGYMGFSDFLSIGEGYSESGFLPYAVAIHISYSDDEDRIRIRHFTSDSNDDNSDVAGKFAEALEKLITWCNDTGYDSKAIQSYREYHENGHFPGLGTLKKLSLINHIELVMKLI